MIQAYDDEDNAPMAFEDLPLPYRIRTWEEVQEEWNEKQGPLGYLYGKEMTAPQPKTLQDICDGLFGRQES